MLPEEFLLWIILLKWDSWETSDAVYVVGWIFVVGECFVASGYAGSCCDVNCGRIWLAGIMGLISWNSSFMNGIA